MNNGMMTLSFMLGAACGAFAMWRILKDKYEQQAREEIEEVRSYYAKKAEHEKILVSEGYVTAESAAEKEEGRAERMTESKPYVIRPDEFDELDDYDVESLTYWSDGILTDDNDDVIENVDEVVGLESLTHFGEFEDDSVFVRNDRLKCDYEILIDYRSYSETEHDATR